MSVIDESNADVMAMALTDTDAMPGAETGVYNRFGNTNGLSINLHVNRHPVEPAGEAGRGREWRITVFVPANTNITTINLAGDSITLPTNRGETASEHPVVEILEQSAAGWVLLLR
jgi:hypothetical protein